MLRQIITLTQKKLNENLNFSLKTLTFFLAPLLWLLVFLFLRQAKTAMELPNGTVEYAIFLVLGISMWRGISELMRQITNGLNTERSILRIFLRLPGGKKILFYSLTFYSVILSLIVTGTIIIAGIIFFGFTINPQYLWLATIVYFFVILGILGISFILLSLASIHRDLGSIRYILTAIFALLSGVFFPVAFYPHPFNWVALTIPFTQGVFLIQNLLLFNEPSFDLKIFIILIIESLILLLIGYRLFMKNIERQI